MWLNREFSRYQTKINNDEQSSDIFSGNFTLAVLTVIVSSPCL